MTQHIYFNKRTDDTGEEFITVGMKVDINGTQYGAIEHIPAETFWRMIHQLQAVPSAPIIYIDSES